MLAFICQIQKLTKPHADVAELADALDSKSGVFGRGGSSPSIGTMWSFFKFPTTQTKSERGDFCVCQGFEETVAKKKQAGAGGNDSSL